MAMPWGGGCPPGEHVWCAYDDDVAFMAVVAAYFAEGVAQGQRLIWRRNEQDDAGLVSALAAHDLSADELVAAGQLVIRPNRPIGSFTLDHAMATWECRAREAEAAGYSGLRVASQVPPPPDGALDGEALTAYEFHADRALARSGSVALCGYDLRRWPADAVALVETFHGPRICTGTAVGGAPFSVRARADGTAVAGEIYAFDAPLFARSLSAVTGERGHVVVDLGSLEFIGAAGLARLAHAATAWEGAGQRVSVRGAPAVVERCWSILGFTSSTSVCFS